MPAQRPRQAGPRRHEHSSSHIGPIGLISPITDRLGVVTTPLPTRSSARYWAIPKRRPGARQPAAAPCFQNKFSHFRSTKAAASPPPRPFGAARPGAPPATLLGVKLPSTKLGRGALGALGGAVAFIAIGQLYALLGSS